MSLIQLVLVLFAAFAVARVMGRFRAGVIRLSEGLLWTSLWVGVAVVVLDPSLTQRLARVLGVGRHFERRQPWRLCGWWSNRNRCRHAW